MTGTTVIQHDSEAPTTVEQCQKPGCYGRSVDYSFPADQLAALMDLSAQCHQTVKVNKDKTEPFIIPCFSLNGLLSLSLSL